MSATERRSSTREAYGSALSSAARSSSAASSSAEISWPVRKCLGKSGSIRRVLVLTWNLFHGRAQPPAGRALMGEFARTLAGWEWDVALLQEVQPWWPPVLARVAAARQVSVLTSRNSLLPLRRAIAVRAPDLIKANGGGANAILA